MNGLLPRPGPMPALGHLSTRREDVHPIIPTIGGAILPAGDRLNCMACLVGIAVAAMDAGGRALASTFSPGFGALTHLP